MTLTTPDGRRLDSTNRRLDAESIWKQEDVKVALITAYAASSGANAQRTVISAIVNVRRRRELE